eukprot:TRINITY_DN1522_c0_g1_i1.p1 TRINITY_DN1522_c0_g1~~TRINITY_DN1522_c0_g1_i1.p1  ORF type:complete len:401 (+),score=82.33 TRINITY_DN1522_c0_g1_i1:36-1205(+)
MEVGHDAIRSLPVHPASTNPDMRRVAVAELTAFVDRVMQGAGCSPEQAAIVAEILVAADHRGVHSHGVNRLEMYVNELLNKEIDPKGEPEIVSQTDAVACVDGHNGVGMPVAKFCMELAIEKAKKHGVGWVVCRGANHYGIAGYYAMMASKQGMMGMSFTNTSPVVFPSRSAKPALGTNPISLAAPSTDPSDPFVLDMATSAVAIGKVEYKHRQGVQVPDGWGVDKTGTVTQEPEQILNGGGLLPLGGIEETSGYKGFGLAMMVEIFCGILAGADYATNIPPWRQGRGRAANLGQCFICVDPAAFGGGFPERMSDLMHTVRHLPSTSPSSSSDSSSSSSNSKPVLSPGDPEKAWETLYSREGIALHKNLIEALQHVATRVSVDPLVVMT